MAILAKLTVGSAGLADFVPIPVTRPSQSDPKPQFPSLRPAHAGRRRHLTHSCLPRRDSSRRPCRLPPLRSAGNRADKSCGPNFRNTRFQLESPKYLQHPRPDCRVRPNPQGVRPLRPASPGHPTNRLLAATPTEFSCLLARCAGFSRRRASAHCEPRLHGVLMEPSSHGES